MPPKPAILLDSNAGAPLHPVVVEALFAFLASEKSGKDDSIGLGNPASIHSFGRRSQALIADAADAILSTVRASPAEWGLVFTSGGTEANQLAVRTAIRAMRNKGVRPKWLVSEVEHSCVLDLESEMVEAGVEISGIKPEPSGEVRASFDRRSSPNTLCSIIGAGNETGILNTHITSHILSAESATLPASSLMHTDYVAGWGKAPLDLSIPGGPDLVAIAGHKLGGLAGVGALIHRKALVPIRAGTPNLAGIISMKALADHWLEVVEGVERLRVLRDRFELDLLERFPLAVVTGKELRRVPHVSHFYFPGLGKDLSLVNRLDFQGFAVSAGSACASQGLMPSHVLLAMGIPELDARNAVRVSLHPGNRPEDLTGLLDALSSIFKRHEAR